MVLLVIDVQNGITDNRLYNFEGFISNLKQLINQAREKMRLDLGQERVILD